MMILHKLTQQNRQRHHIHLFIRTGDAYEHNNINNKSERDGESLQYIRANSHRPYIPKDVSSKWEASPSCLGEHKLAVSAKSFG